MAKFRRAYSKGQLTTQVEEIVAVSEKRMIALMRQSLSDVIDNAQLATAKGGRMRVDTGFLRASGQASLNGMPQGPSRGELTDRHAYDDGNGANPNVDVRLGELELGGVFYFGWTAAYARYREVFDGFLEGALQHWPRIVAFNTETIRERIKK